MPLYALYALWFGDSGLTDAQVSVLFLVWSVVGFVFEVPSGALADRFSRRGCLVGAGIVQAAGFAVWVILPTFAGFTAGFVCWGISTALISGAFEALVFDRLAEEDATAHYQRILGVVTAISLTAQLPAALAATALFAIGGYPLVGWVSVGICLCASGLGLRLPEPARHLGNVAEVADPMDLAGAGGYLTALRTGIADAAADSAVRTAVLGVALLGGFDALDEYFPLLAQDWQVATAAVPVAILVIPLAGAIGAAASGLADRLDSRSLATILVLAVLLLGGAAVLHQPIGLLGVAVFYGLYQLVLVAADARLQHRITGSARATVTSVASLGTEIAAVGLYLGWAAGGLGLIVVAGLLLALMLPKLT